MEIEDWKGRLDEWMKESFENRKIKGKGLKKKKGLKSVRQKIYGSAFRSGAEAVHSAAVKGSFGASLVH